MSPEEIRVAVSSYLASNWTETSVAYPNQEFTPPENGYWLRMTLLLGAPVIGELGVDGVGLRPGVLMLDLFGPRGDGTKTLSEYAAALEALFRRQSVDGVEFEEAGTVDVGPDDAGYHFQVSVNFHAWVGE